MKFKSLLCLVLCMCMMVGCGTVGNVGTDTQKESQQSESEVQTEVENQKDTQEEKADLPYGTDCGDGVMFIATPSGTSQDGNVPTLLEDEDVFMDMISLNAEGFDGAKWSYVYIDGVLVEKEQLADTSTTLTIEGSYLTEGEHTVSVVQYDTNEEGGKVILYKEAKYKVQY